LPAPAGLGRFFPQCARAPVMLAVLFFSNAGFALLFTMGNGVLFSRGSTNFIETRL